MKKKYFFSIVLLLLISTNLVKASTTICTGTTTRLHPTSLLGTWSSSNTSIATVNESGVVTGVSVGAATITYTDNSLLGLIGGLLGEPSITTTVITVIGAPTLVAATATPDQICSGTTLTLTGSATGATSYLWTSPGGAAIASATSESTSVSAVTTANSGVYTLSATNTCGTTSATSAAVAITVAAPQSVTASATPNPVCSGSTLALTGGATGATSYLWTGPTGTTISSATSENAAVIGISADNAGTYVLSATNVCGTTTASTGSITVNSAPLVSGSVDDVTCNGYGNGDIILAVSGGSGSYSALWSNGSTLAYGDFALTAGSYSVIVTSSTGCTGIGNFTVGAPAQITGIASITNSDAADSNGAINFTASGGTPPYTYSWSNGAASENICGLSHGDYCIAVSDANSCSFNDCYYVNQNTDGERLSNGGSNSAASIAQNVAYPNPFTSTTNVTFTVPTSGHTTVEVFSAVNGQKIATVFDNDTKASIGYNCTIDGANLPSGLYIYKIVSENTTSIGKVLLVK